MNVFDLIRNELSNKDIPDDVLQQKAQAIASEYGVNLDAIIDTENNTYDKANVDFIAAEINKTTGGLATVESNGGAITAPPENDKKKTKKGVIEPNQSQSVESLKPAVQSLKTAVAGESEALIQVFDRKASEVEDAVTNKILSRCKQISPNIVSKVSEGLQEYTSESASFREEIGSIFDEDFADFLNPAT